MRMTRLAVTSAVCLGPWNGRQCDEASGSGGEAEPLPVPPVPGFVESRFNPLVHAAVKELFDRGAFRAGERTALVLGSLFGDAETNDLASRLLIRGQPDNALLFYQSVMNSIVGFLARETGIAGTTLVVTAYRGLTTVLLEQADLLLASGDADQVVLVGAEIAGSAKSDEVWLRAGRDGRPHEPLADIAAAAVVERAELAAAEGRPILSIVEASGACGAGSPPVAEQPPRLGGIQGLAGLAEALSRLTEGGDAAQPVVIRDYSMGGYADVIRVVRPGSSD